MVTLGYPFWHSEDSCQLRVVGAARLISCGLELVGLGCDTMQLRWAHRWNMDRLLEWSWPFSSMAIGNSPWAGERAPVTPIGSDLCLHFSFSVRFEMGINFSKILWVQFQIDIFWRKNVEGKLHPNEVPNPNRKFFFFLGKLKPLSFLLWYEKVETW